MLLLTRISPIQDSVPKTFHKQLYHALFESHMTYCISVWGGQSFNALNKLFTIQKRCVRMLFSNPNKNSFCHCRGKETQSMIYCQRCNEWFHYGCIGLSEQAIDNIDNFYCNECLNHNSHLAVNTQFQRQSPSPIATVTENHTVKFVILNFLVGLGTWSPNRKSRHLAS